MTEAKPKSFRPDRLKVVQLNAENLFLFLDDTSPRDWRKLTEREWQSLSSATVPNKSLLKTWWLADSLRAIDADIVCMNEVGGMESLHNFAKIFLDDKYVPHLIEGNSDRGIDIGYLVRKDFESKVELRSHKERPLGFLYPHEVDTNLSFEGLGREKRSHYFSRDCAELRILNDHGIPKLILLLVHLKSKLDPDGIDAQGRLRREAEVKTLVKIYQEIRAEFQPPVPVIVAGDFNGYATRKDPAEEFAEMRTTDLESVVDLIGVEGEAAATQLQFNRAGGVNFLQIDFIFISPELKDRLMPEASGVFRYLSDLQIPLPLPRTLEQRTYLPSDHYPVVATFKLT